MVFIVIAISFFHFKSYFSSEVPEDKFQILVTGDVGPVEFCNTNTIKSVLKDQLEVRKLGEYTVLQNGFSITFFQGKKKCGRVDKFLHFLLFFIIFNIDSSISVA